MGARPGAQGHAAGRVCPHPPRRQPVSGDRKAPLSLVQGGRPPAGKCHRLLPGRGRRVGRAARCFSSAFGPRRLTCQSRVWDACSAPDAPTPSMNSHGEGTAVPSADGQSSRHRDWREGNPASQPRGKAVMVTGTLPGGWHCRGWAEGAFAHGVCSLGKYSLKNPLRGRREEGLTFGVCIDDNIIFWKFMFE